MKHIKELKAIKGQLEHATRGGGTDKAYNGLCIAFLALIQAWDLSLEDAIKAREYVEVYFSKETLKGWLGLV